MHHFDILVLSGKKYFEDQQAVYQGRLHLPVYKHMRMCLERELIFISSSEDKKSLTILREMKKVIGHY